MFWILRRTGAANFFNSINNNYSSKGPTNNNNNSDRNSQRPPRKAYGRLSVEDDTQNKVTPRLTLNNVDHFNDIENFNILDTKSENNDFSPVLCDVDSDLDIDGDTSSKDDKNRHINENNFNRLQAMAISDDDEYDESLTCNVCDRAFHCHRQLASHQQKKRHFGCSGCDSLFPSLMLLEHHKEEFEHWSDDEENGHPPCCRRNRGDDFSDTDSITSDAESEDLERLL